MQMDILATQPRQSIVLFANDSELTEFKRRLELYQTDAPEGRKNPEYAGLFGSIEQVSELEPADRIGEVLRSRGFTDIEAFKDDQTYLIDVELWQASTELIDSFCIKVESTLLKHNGLIINRYQGVSVTLLRVEGSGAAIKSVLELSEVYEIDLPPQPDFPPPQGLDIAVGDLPAIEAPENEVPIIGIIDSGITSAHPLLAPAVAARFGVPEALGDSDEKGHGTPVSGVLLYGDISQRIQSKKLKPEFRVASARVVNNLGKFDEKLVVPQQMEIAIRGLAEAGCRVINISLGDPERPASHRPSPWAETLDRLARELDLIIVVCAGNRTDLLNTYGDGVVGAYPSYLFDGGSRLLEPASAAIAVTVGSLAHTNGLKDADEVGVQSIASADQPSPFTRIGPGSAKLLKPDFVDYGGTVVFDGVLQTLSDGAKRSEAGIVSTYHKYLDRLLTSYSGTSFASPLVAYKAAALLKSLPNSSANLIRALLALSAHRPEPAVACLTGRDEEEVAFVLGKGIPQLESAIASEDNRVILYAEDEIPADHFAVFEVPIPAVFHSTPGTKEISVALAFDPPVRRSRQEYLGNLMSFDLFRGADPNLVFDHCRKWDKKAEGKAPYKLANKYRCDLSPGIKLRKRTTLQTGHFSASRDMSQYGERYFLTVRCEAGWSGEDQSFAVAVELKHAAEIPLYVEVQRIRIRT